jgi:hypothetical protein
MVNKVGDKAMWEKQLIVASIRSEVERCFGALKRIMKHRKTRCGCLKKNESKNFLVFALLLRYLSHAPHSSSFDTMLRHAAARLAPKILRCPAHD